MRIRFVTTHQYQLPLTEAVVWGGAEHVIRTGALVRIEDPDGRVGWGDAAPLPGFSREMLPEVLRAIDEWAPMVLGEAFDASDIPRGDGPIANLTSILPSAARFAVETAMVDLAAQALGVTMAQVLSPDPHVTVALSGLLMGDDSDKVVEHARYLRGRGFRSFKLKVGRRSVAYDARLVNALCDGVVPPETLRLDANRAWTTDEARRFAAAVEGARIDYIEEPLRDPEGLPELWLDTQLPIALDETLQQPGGEASLRGWAAAAVLKPTLVGGLLETLRLASVARSVGVRPVLSSAFESSVGLRAIAGIAAAVGESPAGLDTARWLAGDMIECPWNVNDPVIDIPAVLRNVLHPAVS